MNRSSKYNFYLPQNTDPMSVSDFNANFETIDSKLLTQEQTLTSTEKAAIRTNAGLGASATRSVANNLTTEESGAVLDARQGKALNEKIAERQAQIFYPTPMSGANVVTITVPNSSVHMLVISNPVSTRHAILIAHCSQTGAITLSEAYKGSGITLATDTNTITVTFAGATSCRVNDFAMYGDPVTAVKTS